jgi:sugar phosphate isomerase/epimerase
MFEPHHAMNRRAFLAAAAASSTTFAATLRGSRPKVGCLSWCFHNFAPAADQEAALDQIGPLGFDGVEMILLARQDLDSYWTDERIRRIRRKLEHYRLELPQFVLFQPVVEGLTSVQPEVRRQNLDYFDAGCQLAKKLGAPMVNIVAPWPTEWRRPGGGYLPRHFEVENPKPGEVFSIEIAPGFDWDRVWAAFIEAIKGCLERCRHHGLRLSLEHHTHCLVPDAVSFLRLWDAIKDPLLGYNLDTGWTLLQREYPPVAIHKVKHHLFNVHVRDIDGTMRRFVHVGEGVMDFKAVAAAAKNVGYAGYFNLEQDKFPGDMKATCQRYLRMMRAALE